MTFEELIHSLVKAYQFHLSSVLCVFESCSKFSFKAIRDLTSVEVG